MPSHRDSTRALASDSPSKLRRNASMSTSHRCTSKLNLRRTLQAVSGLPNPDIDQLSIGIKAPEYCDEGPPRQRLIIAQFGPNVLRADLARGSRALIDEPNVAVIYNLPTVMPYHDPNILNRGSDGR